MSICTSISRRPSFRPLHHAISRSSWVKSDALSKTRSVRLVSRGYSVSQQTPAGQRDKAALGVFTPQAAGLFIAAGVGLFFYFRHEKSKLLKAREQELEEKQVGRAHVGGPFSLTTHDGHSFSEHDLLGKWSMLYFGFTNCPDICPAELDKIGTVIDALEKEHDSIIQPVFISVDPARDSAKQIARYLDDFHPRLIGLRGDYAETKSICRAYRVYFSTPPNADTNGDYLVDHSIFIYLMNPNGEFVDAFGQSTSMEQIVERTNKEIVEWQRQYQKKA